MEIRELTKTIDHKMIVHDINFSINKGEITGIIGRNGSGKTTIFRTIAGHYSLDGDVLINGISLREDVTLKNRLFYIDAQYNMFSSMTPKTIGEYYQIAYQDFDMDKYKEMLAKHQLPYKRRYQQYSKGMQGLFNMILAFSTGAEYLIFDEPFDGLDVIVKKQVINLLLDEISNGRCGILLSSHNLKELETIIDNALIIKEGTIIANYSLENSRETARKIQLVFKEKELPDFIKEKGILLNVSGRVVTVFFDNYSLELQEQIQQLNPVLLEELPLSLEDMFVAKFTDEHDYQLFD